MMPESETFEGSVHYLKIYALLIRTAEQRQLVHYADVARILGLPAQGSYTARMVGRLLGEIVEKEFERNRPMLSAVAVSQTNNRPGKGFYGLAEHHGLIASDATSDERIAFWQTEMERVYVAWKD